MSVVERILKASWAVTILGLVAIALATLLGFEEPVEPLLLIGTLLIIFPPLAIAAHLMWTGELTRAEKRLWLRELVSWRAGSALGSYLRSTDRRGTLQDLVAERR